ncbi:MAG: MEDS domain-containing protein [Promethearchaeota archaeon]
MILTNTINKESDIISYLTWGSHLCYFYNTKYDLLNLLVPYFQIGLENNEFCLWVTSEDLKPEFVKKALREAIPDFDNYLKKGQIKILPHTKWYLKNNDFNLEKVLKDGMSYFNHAINNGYSGLRITGDARWIKKTDLDGFIDYETYVNTIIEDYKIIAICTYPIRKFNKFELIDIASSHQLLVIIENGKYKIIENVGRKKINQEKKLSHSNVHNILKMEMMEIQSSGVAQNFINLLNLIKKNAEVAMIKINKEEHTYKNLKNIHLFAKLASELTQKMFKFRLSKNIGKEIY